MHFNLEAQNKETNLQVLAAKDVLYTQSAFWTYLVYISALLPLVLQGLKLIPVLEPFISGVENGINLIGLIAVVGIDRMLKNQVEQATRLAEEFDVNLFGLAWNESVCGQKVPPDTRIRLAGKKDLDYYKNWYSPVELSTVSRNLAILLCQRQSTYWDKAQKKRFASFLLLILVAGMGVLVLLGIINKQLTFVSWLSSMLFPASGFLVKTYTLHAAFKEAATRQDALATDIDVALNEYFAKKELVTDDRLRRFQDRVFEYRKENTNVPGWLYRRFRTADQKLSDQVTKELIDKVHESR